MLDAIIEADTFVPFERVPEPPSRESVDAAVFRIANMNARLTLAQAKGDRAAVLIIEGQLAALRAS